MKKYRITAFALVLILLFTGCSTAVPKGCAHSWERAENLNEYTAADQCSLCGTTRIYTDPDSISHSGTETGFKLLRYNFDGYGIAQKELTDCDLGYAIIDCLSKLQDTGTVIPAISEDPWDPYAFELPVDRGTLWIECGSLGLFRVDPSVSEICRAQTHLGEAQALQMTDTLAELLRQAWYYYPYDCWQGTYKDGAVTLQQVYKMDSVVDGVVIDSLHIENKIDSANNKITLYIRAKENTTEKVTLETYQSSDNLGSVDSKEITLVQGQETALEWTFYGFYNCTYYLSVTVGNTKITLTVDPRTSN